MNKLFGNNVRTEGQTRQIQYVPQLIQSGGGGWGGA